MPEKRLVGNQSKSFIEERMQVRDRPTDRLTD